MHEPAPNGRGADVPSSNPQGSTDAPPYQSHATALPCEPGLCLSTATASARIARGWLSYVARRVATQRRRQRTDRVGTVRARDILNAEMDAAASRIAGTWRGHDARAKYAVRLQAARAERAAAVKRDTEIDAALTLQAWVARHWGAQAVARARVTVLRDARERAVMMREWQEREADAVAVLHRFWARARRHLFVRARWRVLHRSDERLCAAVVLQAAWRGSAARRRVRLQRREAAIAQAQAVWNGYRGRQRVERLLHGRQAQWDLQQRVEVWHSGTGGGLEGARWGLASGVILSNGAKFFVPCLVEGGTMRLVLRPLRLSSRQRREIAIIAYIPLYPPLEVCMW